MSLTAEQLSNQIAAELLEAGTLTRQLVNQVKFEICRRNHSPSIPSNAEILRVLSEPHLSRLKPFLTAKQVRGVSGVTTVAVMPKPWACPHGKCTYCPGGPEVGVPRAYTGKEPAVLRALENAYDPRRQVLSRLLQLRAAGHVVDKVELILVGGTFPFLPRDYQEAFVKSCLDGINGEEAHSLEEAKTRAETASVRNVGITIETRPDWSKRVHVDHMLSLGVTRVELGVQTLYDDVYNRIHRDHTVADVEDATRILKESGLKVGYHMMLGLPGCDYRRDLDAFRRIFEDPEFKPDMLKIYPCLVTPGTKLYDEWREGTYKPYSTEESVRLIVELKHFVPRWVRIMRIQREIPANGIAHGVKHGNLRQLVHDELVRLGNRCNCIRCREVGQVQLATGSRFNPGRLELRKIVYEASGGTEVFLSYEEPDADVLAAYLRLRILGREAHRPEIGGLDSAIVRELHVLGQTIAVGGRGDGAFQHRGLGSALLKEAERVAREDFERRKMLVISALGTRQYYARFGYVHDGPYMSKSISS